jgi:hypothetical protein
MADYYPLLAKALANLPSRTTSTARRAIYDRARKALIGQLRSIQPPMPEGDIAGEDAALDRAIARLEAEFGGQSTPPAAAAASPKTPATAPSSVSRTNASVPRANPTPTPTATPPGPKPSAAPTTGARPPPPRPAPPPRPVSTAATPSVAAPPAAPSAATPPAARPLVPPAAARRPSLGGSSPAAPTLSIEPAKPAPTAPSPSLAPPVEARSAASADDRSLAPAVAPSSPAVLAPPALKAAADGARPSAPGRAEARRRNPWPMIAIALALGIAGAIAASAYFWREPTPDFAVKTTGEPPVIAAPESPNKIAERIKAGDQADATPAAGETPIPTVTVPVAPVSAGPATPAPAPAPPAAASPATPAPAAGAPSSDVVAQSPATTDAQATPVAAVPGASPAAILIALANDPQKPAVNLGSAVWSIIPAVSGQPSTLGVRIEIDIPDQKMHATVTIRKNADASLPATHTIDLRTTFADGAQIKGIQDMDLPRLRKGEAPTGDPVSGVRVKINDSYFLVGLTRSDADAAHNLDLLTTRDWFDFPLLLNDNRIAKLTFEKGPAGDQVMSQALSAWN